MKPKTPPVPLRQRLREFWQRWGQATIVAVVAHLIIGSVVYVLYRLSLPPPPRYVVVDLIAPSGSPAPSASPAAAPTGE